MHSWGDEDVDWVAISGAANYIGTFSRKWGRIGGQYKEKWGTVRFYASLGWLSLHTLTHPGYVYSQYPDWLWKLDCKYISPLLMFLFGKPFINWQIFVYRKAYANALKRWPHIREEILVDADYKEYLRDL